MKNKKNQLTKKELGLEDLGKIEKMKRNISRPDLFHHFEEDYLRKIALDRKNLSKKENDEIAEKLIRMHGLENGFWVSNISVGKYRSALTKMRQKIIEEYDCKSSIELMLADKIVTSFWRIMKCEEIYNRIFQNEEGVFAYTQLTINMLKEINRGLEITHHQHNNNIILLKELKQPNLKVTVKTDNAYFAENQQINNNKGNDVLKDNTEIIKS